MITATADYCCHCCHRLLLPSSMIPGTIKENISDFQNSEVPPSLHSSTTISIHTHSLFRPIQCAESNSSICSPIASLVVEHQVKTSPVVENLKPPFSASTNYH